MLAALAVAAVAASSSGLPLESVSYTVEVAGPLAEVVIRQRFRNDGDTFVDATYLFPLDDGAAVDAMVVVVGDRIVRSRIRGRDEAREIYEDAAATGRVAALTEQQRPNVFTQAVANLPPGVPIDVELHLVQPVDRIDGTWELVLPLVAAPRFVPPGQADDVAARYLVPGAARDGLPDEAIRSDGTGVRATIDLTVHAGVPIQWLTSTSHAVAPRLDGPDADLVVDEMPLTRDVVVRWQTATDAPTSALLVSGHHAMLLLEPPAQAPFEERVPRELVWVVDTSFSMSGAPLATAKAAMEEALRAMDPRDSFVVLGFGDEVEALSGAPVPATFANVVAGLQFVRGLEATGGTFLAKALDQALALPLDPRRRRTVVLVTDGHVANDAALLAAIARRADDATFTALGIGGSPNRWVLEDLATLGGGVVAYASLQGDGGAAMAGLVAAMDRPVWTGLLVDWGDCAPSGQAPARIPELRAGRPLRILVRLDGPCTDAVQVSARTARGAVTLAVEPTRVSHDRAIASTWARERVADLERLQLRGEVDDVSAAVREIGLSTGIVTSETSLVAVDTRIVNPLAERDAVEVLLDLPDGEEGVGEVTVIAGRRAIDTESTSRGSVLTKEFLNRVPTGRSFQGATAIAAGVTGGGGNPNMGGGAFDENTYMIDGANITDPVTGTFSLNFNFDAIQQVEVLDAVRMPEHPGGQPIVNAVSDSGTNHLEAHVAASGAALSADPLSGGAVSGGVAGPLVRDRVWGLADAATSHQAFAGVRADQARLFGKLTSQPVVAHRFTLEGAGDPSSLTWAGGRAAYGGGLGLLRWQWFPSPTVNVETTASGARRAVGMVGRDQVDVRAVLRVLSVDDPLGGDHDLATGLGTSRRGWTAADGPTSVDLVEGFVQDAWNLDGGLWLKGGVRLDAVSDGGLALLPSPRVVATWDPWGDQRTKVGGGYGRSVDLARVLPGIGPGVSDELSLVLEREVIEDLALTALGTWSRERFAFAASPELVPVPTLPAPTVERDVARLSLGLRKVLCRRWAADAGWTFTPTVPVDPALLRDPSAPFVPGFLSAYRRHRLAVSASWDLPTDPWTTAFGGFAEWASAVHVGADAWWLAPAATVGASLSQRVDLRVGALELRASVAWADNDAGGAVLPLEVFALVPGAPSIGDQPPLRLEAQIRYAL